MYDNEGENCLVDFEQKAWTRDDGYGFDPTHSEMQSPDMEMERERREWESYVRETAVQEAEYEAAR
jgi:hypothetical protein